MEPNNGSSERRNPYWKELTTDEKCERMREIIKNLQTQMSQVTSDTYRNYQQFNMHSHDQSGRPVTPISPDVRGIGLGGTLTGASTPSSETQRKRIEAGEVYF